MGHRKRTPFGVWVCVNSIIPERVLFLYIYSKGRSFPDILGPPGSFLGAKPSVKTKI
jgi:hypothetical protein